MVLLLFNGDPNEEPFYGDYAFQRDFDLAEEEGTILYYNKDPQKRLTSGSFTIDPVHSSIVQVDDGKTTTHQLLNSMKKIDIRKYATTHEKTGREVVKMDGFDGKRFSVPTHGALCLPLSTQVQPGINFDEMQYRPGPTKIKIDKYSDCTGYI
jgi:hypothetical protein